MHQFHPWPPLRDFVPPEETNGLLWRIREQLRSATEQQSDGSETREQLPYEDEVTWRARLRLIKLRTTLQSALGARRTDAAAQRTDLLDGARSELKQVVDMLQLRELGVNEEARDNTPEELPALLQPPPPPRGGAAGARTAASLWRAGARKSSAATSFRDALLKAGVAVRDRRGEDGGGGAAQLLAAEDGTRVAYRLAGRAEEKPPPRLPAWLDRPEEPSAPPEEAAAAAAPAAAQAVVAAAAAPTAVVAAAAASASFEVDLRAQPIVARWQGALATKEEAAAATVSGGGGSGGGGRRRRVVQKWQDAGFAAQWAAEPQGDTLLERLQWRSTKLDGDRAEYRARGGVGSSECTV